MIIKSSLGLSFGVVFSVLLFKRRAWPAWVGLGFGAGRAWEEADGMFIPAFHDVKSPKSCFEEIQSLPAASAAAFAALALRSSFSFASCRVYLMMVWPVRKLEVESAPPPAAIGVLRAIFLTLGDWLF